MRKDHPLRPIRTMVDKVLKELSPEFNKMYSKVGRPSIPPEQLLRALLLQMLYSVRSERLLVEEIDYNILFRWFVGLNLDDALTCKSRPCATQLFKSSARIGQTASLTAEFT